MAASKHPTDPNKNIPDYEYADVNTKPFHIGSFRSEWLNRLKPSDYSYQREDDDTFDANFVREMGISAETMTDLKAICSLDSLRCHPEDQQPNTDVVPPDATLKTLVQRKTKKDYKATLKLTKTNRHDLYAAELDRLTVGRKPDTVADMIPEGEIILTINVYYPAVIERFTYVRPHMTLLMTGSHSLAELRDAICCVSDLQVCGEFSNTPDMAPDFISKDHFKSAFFFFEGVFYNDMRFPECQDISMTTIEWAKARNFPTYSQAKMEDTRFVDLTVKVGFPYLYCHQGDCEHLVIITDIRDFENVDSDDTMHLEQASNGRTYIRSVHPVSQTNQHLTKRCKRLTHENDCLDKKLYPLLTHKHRVATQKCAVCHVFIGRWFTTNDQFAPSDPCLFCDKCFRMLHYDVQGNKLGDFLAYLYVDRGAFN